MTTSSTNYTGLYGGGASVGPIPNTAYGNANVVGLLAAGSDGANTITAISATGNITSDQYFIGNGSLLTGLASSYGNADVAGYLASGTLSSNIITSANISGSYILGNGSQLTGLPATYANANVVSLLANFGSNVISTTGNITSGNLNIGSSGKVVVGVAGLNNTTITPGQVSATTFTGTGTVTTDYFYGDGSNIVNLQGGYVVGNVSNAVHAYFADVANSVSGSNVSGAVANATYAVSAGSATTATSATTAGTVTTAAQPNITSVGTLTSLSSSGNVTAAYFIGNGSLLSNINAGNIVGGYGNANVVSLLANFGSNTISTTGNITGGNIIGTHVGSGAALSSITGANVTGTVANATYATSAGSATTAGTVTTAAQPNITSVGTLTSVTSTGNIQGGNLRTGGLVSAAGDVVGGNLYTGGSISAGANVTGGNINTAGLVSATGNVIGSYILGNGSLLTGLPTGYSNAQVANFLANFGSNVINTTGNITGGNLASSGALGVGTNADIGGNLVVSGAIQATGSNINGGNILASQLVRGATVSAIANVVGGNITTAGQISATGNITSTGNIQGGNIIGTIVGSVAQANVANYVATTATSTSTSYYLTMIDNTGGANSIVYTDGGGNLAYNPSSDTLSVPLISASGNITTGSSINAVTASVSGNVIVPNAGKYRGDFSSAANAGRTLFQTSNTSTLASTFISAIPGPGHVAGPTVTGAATGLFSSNDVGNASIFGMYSQGSDARIWSLAQGTGNTNNITFRFGTGATLGATLTSTGNFSAVGNVTGGNIIGIGSSLTGINAFGNVAVAGQTTVSADNTTDTLTLVAGTSITITTDAANNSITINSTATGGETLSPFLLMGG